MSTNSALVFDKSRGRDWPAIGFLAVVHALALYAMLGSASGASWLTWVLQVVWLCLTGVAIGAGYHRLYAHSSYRYKAKPMMELFYLVFGAGAWQTEVAKWAPYHRAHHAPANADTIRDPYGMFYGFWHAHVGWVLWHKPEPRVPPDLARNRLVMWQSRHYHLLALIVAFALPTLLAMLWADWVSAFWLNFPRVVAMWHFTFLVNSASHYFGTQPDERSSARNIPGVMGHLLSALTFGEGGKWHGYHHLHPTDPNIGQGTTIDLSWWWISLWGKFGLTSTTPVRGLPPPST